MMEFPRRDGTMTYAGTIAGIRYEIDVTQAAGMFSATAWRVDDNGHEQVGAAKPGGSALAALVHAQESLLKHLGQAEPDAPFELVV